MVGQVCLLHAGPGVILRESSAFTSQKEQPLLQCWDESQGLKLHVGRLKVCFCADPICQDCQLR
jgi:hypothetical protein